MLKNEQRELGAFIWFGYRLPLAQRARLLREAGFEAALHWWDDSFARAEGSSKEAQADLIRKEGLFIENAHLPVDQINDLWLDTLDGDAALGRYLSDLDSLSACGIPVAVLHTSNGLNPPPVSAAGIGRFRTLADHAEKRGVRIALENVRCTHMLTETLDAIDAPALGFCYDSGHDQVWSPVPYALLSRYQDRLFAVHLHDNWGQEDEHAPPGEGRTDWAIVRSGIAHSTYQGAYTLESDSTKIPAARTAQEHLRLHYNGAVASLY